MSRALSVTVSCCQVIETVRRRIDQRARRGEDHVRAPRVLLQRRVVLVRDTEVGLVREEHHDEVGRRIELPPVPLGGRACRCAREPGARDPRSGAALRVVGRLERVEIRGERRLRVDDDVLPAGDAHDEIGAQSAVVGRHGRLRDVVAVLDHAGVLDDVAQLRLAPAPADVRRAERVREAAGPLRSVVTCVCSAPYASCRTRSTFLQLLVHPLERVLERPHMAGELRLRELEEPRAVRVERLGRDRLHHACEPLVARVALRRRARPPSRRARARAR